VYVPVKEADEVSEACDLGVPMVIAVNTVEMMALRRDEPKLSMTFWSPNTSSCSERCECSLLFKCGENEWHETMKTTARKSDCFVISAMMMVPFL
jgi:hypothetical protein